eukprot:CAMPEP_0170651946 /NCGR_PEP_ID=MMETSP0224-20130122/46640_1 /TAXON_ID=285029 /ORGANISM="Togula jolla, Strain CCCM 725" /LENGTH=122 /DNA_ID=CAMNT_0010983775 /DNA_START=385 /DNA_END=753 /DNA_ORIENTATION=-
MRKAPLNAASSPWKSVSRPVTTQTVTAPQPAAKLPRRGSARQHRPIATAIKAASAKAEALLRSPTALRFQRERRRNVCDIAVAELAMATRNAAPLGITRGTSIAPESHGDLTGGWLSPTGEL